MAANKRDYKYLIISLIILALGYAYLKYPREQLKTNDHFILATDFELAAKIDYFITNQLNNQQTELCRIMNHERSDKGNGWHNYTQLYYFLLKDLKDKELNIFEVGIGTNNTDVASNMSKNGMPGASLRGWRTFFPKSFVYGADIDQRILFTEERIKTFYVDQLKPNTIKEMWAKIGSQQFDLIIDDGLHTYEANTTFLEHSFARLKPGGLYIIEDIVLTDDNIINFYNYLIKHKYRGVIVKIPNPHNTLDNCLVVIRK